MSSRLSGHSPVKARHDSAAADGHVAQAASDEPRAPKQAWVRKWDTIYYAIGDTGRTIRLCAVLLAISISCIPPLLIMVLIHGWLG